MKETTSDESLTFSEYLNPHYSLEDRLQCVFHELRVSEDETQAVCAFLEPLRKKDPITHTHYMHSIRVGLLSRNIARFMHLDEKALFYAGLLHDIGKCLVCLETLGKTSQWTPNDTANMEAHVTDSYRFLRGRFDFTADIVILHHRFQAGAYPAVLPPPLHTYSEGTMVMIMLYGRMLALADVYDALHRINSKFGALSGEEIKAKMLEYNPDQRRLIEDLYATGIFTSSFVETAPH